MLFIISVIWLGDHLCLDVPAILEEAMLEKLNIRHVEFNLLFSIVAIPNLIVPFFGGAFIDKFGINSMVMIYSFVMFLS